jgi:hypothetical protein
LLSAVGSGHERNEAVTNPCHMCNDNPKVWKCTACGKTRVRKLRVVR